MAAADVPSTDAPRPSWPRRHAASLIAVSVLSAWMLFANFSGIPGLARLGENSTGGAPDEHIVYGWPFATYQEYSGTNSGGGSFHATTRRSDGINVVACALLLLFTVFVTDWSTMRALAARLRSSEAPASAAEARRAFWKRWLAVVRVLVGLCAMALGAMLLVECMTMALRLDENSTWSLDLVNRSNSSSISAHGGGTAEPYTYAFGMLAGGVILLAGLALILRRFRLWMAVAALLFLGTLGSLPIMLAPKPTLRAHVSVGIPQALAPARVNRMRARLAPGPLADTLPEPVRARLPAALGVREVELLEKANDQGPGLRLILRFEPGTTDEQRGLAFTIYADYLLDMIERAAKADGQTYRNSGSYNMSQSDWPIYKTDWLKARAAEPDEAP